MTKQIQILLVEDNPADVDLMRENLEYAKVANTTHVASDGIEAMKFLRREPPFEDAPRPDLLLLDLNMPRKDGREVLAEVKDDPDLRVIPVVVLTSSAEEEDVVKSYKLHANCYIRKPIDLKGFEQIVRSIDEFWFSVVRLPPEGSDK